MKLRLLILSIALFNSLFFCSTVFSAENKAAQVELMVKHTDALAHEISLLRGEISAIQAKRKLNKLHDNGKKATPMSRPKKAASKRSPATMADNLIRQRFLNPVIVEHPPAYRSNLAILSTPQKLLEERKKGDIALKKEGLHSSKLPAIEIAGNVITAASVRRSYLNQKSSDVTLAAASVSAAMLVNPWITGLMKFNYDAGGVAAEPARPYHIANSRLFLNTGLITIGDFTRSPFYFSIGQMVVPFGNYGGLVPTLTSRLGKTLQRAIVLGWQPQNSLTGFNAAIYGFRGESRIYGEDRINNGGINISYALKNSHLKFEAGVGAIANIADSAGMQNTRAPFLLFDDWTEADESGDEDFEDDDEQEPLPASFSGFGKTAETEIIAHRVPAVDAYAKVSVQNIGIYGEYTGATRSFDIDDLSFNEYGARPRAANIEADYQFKIWNHLTAVSAGYSRSWESLALNMPQQTIALGLRTSLNKHVVAGLIYRHDRAYGLGNYATGIGLPVLADSTLGRSSSSLTAQLGFKF